MEEFKIYTQNVFERNAIKIYFVLRRDGKHFLGKIKENGQVEFKEINPEESQEDNPTIIMDIYYFELFGKAIFKALEKHHIEPEEKSFVRGKLEATEYHLGDLRRMLKLS